MGTVWEKRGKMGKEALGNKGWQRKKVLSLVLCVAVMLSVMVVGAGAAFSDQSKIKNTEAVDACVALNIIGGYGDNTYRPENNITRAEVCKMICVALNGGKEPTLSVPATPTFKDVRNDANSAWAEKYIESCVAQGIVGGVGNGMFQPSQNVTGSQLAKMLLVALGYKSEIAGFGGNGWDTKVNVVATQKGLYEGLESIDVSAALTRDSAAQMIWNALQAKEVKYDYTLVSENGQLISKIDVVDKEKTLLEDKYDTMDTEETTGIMTGITYNSTKDEYTYTVGGKTYTAEADYTALLGHNVTVVVKANSAKDVYGAFAKDSAVVVSGLIGDIDFAGFNNTKKSIEVDNVDYDVDSTDVLAAYGYSTTSNYYTYTTKQATSNTKDYYEFAAIDNDDDDKIDVIIYYPVTFAKVTYVGSDYVKLEKATVIGDAGTSYDEDYTVYDKAAKDDYAVASYDTSLKSDGIITLVEEQTGKVASYGGDNAVIDGTSYNYKSLDDTSVLTNALNKNVDFWAINGYIVRVDATGSVDLGDYALVTGVTGSTGISGYYEATFLFTDGTTATAPVKSVGDASGKTTAPVAGTLYTYEVSSGKYELTEVTELSANDFDGVASASATWTPADSSSDANAKIAVKDKNNATINARFASDAIVFVDDDGDYSVKTGADLAKVTDPDTTVVVAGAEKNSTNAMTITFAYVSTTGVASSDTMYGFVTSDISYSKDSDGSYQTATIWTGSENVTLTTADKITFPDGTEKGSVVAYKLDADGAISEFVTMDSAAKGALTTIDGDEVIIDGTTYKVDADDTVVIYVDKSANKGVADGSIAVANEKETDGQYYNNVYYFTDDTATGTKTLDLLVVDIDNDWDEAQ